jgi:hypothetical protein
MIYTRDQSCYVFSVPSGYVKVGVSDDPMRRIKEVQAYCYEPVTLEFDTWISAGSPVSGFALEQIVHQKLKAFSGSRREWFKVSASAAVVMVNFAFRFLSMPAGHPKMDSLLIDVECHVRGLRKLRERREKCQPSANALETTCAN